MKETLSNSKGFTLIEVVIAMAVIAIGMFSMMSLIITVTKGNSHSKKVTTATTLAQDQMEQIKRLGFGNAILAQGTEDYGTMNKINGYTSDYNGYRRVTTVFTNTPVAGMVTGSVTVHWTPGTHSITLATSISSP